MKNKEEIERLQMECNSPKHKLIDILNKLENMGELTRAKQLEKIIARLEAWQHK